MTRFKIRKNFQNACKKSLKIFATIGISAPLSLGLITSANAASIISNGTIQLGINDQGHLNVSGGTPSLGGVTDVGLRFLPTGAEATAPGCLCEGWGVADAITGLTGYANVATDGVKNLSLISFIADATKATSIVQLGDSLKITHDYAPVAVTPYLYKAAVTIENIGTAAIGDLRYRRVMDWDIEPTPFSEFVTIKTSGASNVLFTSDDGFASANPLSTPSSIVFTGEAVDSGPNDHGALFDFGFGSLAIGATRTFNIFYGAAPTETEALAALVAADADRVYSLGQASGPDGPSTGIPNTFIFAFSGVGEPPSKSVPESGSMLGVLAIGTFGVSSLLKRQQQQKAATKV
ncbi:MAG: hypothetical protein KME40_18610 [Komarekiella atlantica HA4396-MV6]|jgi:hypothetical protein|nr:hypothetical protein [Komarekiella atlantica HA4396-MV6]